MTDMATIPHPVPPRRILIIRPCCIGDVVLATAALVALRRAYPAAIITWAVSGWAEAVIRNHPMLDYVINIGDHALPVKTWGGFWRMRQVIRNETRNRRYDWVLSFVRSPLMSAAVALGNAPLSAGLASGWRGFGYSVKVPVDANTPRHEAEIYLDVVRALGVDTEGCYATLIPDDKSKAYVDGLLERRNLARQPFILVNPAGGVNPGMTLVSKRYPIEGLAHIADTIADELGAQIVLIAGPDDSAVINDLRAALRHSTTSFIGELDFDQVSALCKRSALYIGNDTGLTHIAAASGAPTAMLMGPSDPRRYAPFTPNSIALWQETTLPAGGVVQANLVFDWSRDGITPDTAIVQLQAFLQGQ